jgi:hypothetical protein
VGFASITTIGIMFGQNLHPDQDLVFSDLYRITSVTVSLVVTLTMVFWCTAAELLCGDAICDHRISQAADGGCASSGLHRRRFPGPVSAARASGIISA